MIENNQKKSKGGARPGAGRKTGSLTKRTRQIAEAVATQGCLDLREAQAIIISQKDNLEEAKEALKISYISYDNGVGINLDVIDSQVALSQVQKNIASAIYDYLTAEAYLDRTMGREYFESNPANSEDANGKKK